MFLFNFSKTNGAKTEKVTTWLTKTHGQLGYFLAVAMTTQWETENTYLEERSSFEEEPTADIHDILSVGILL